jgi:hypothetical protein
VSRIWDDVIAPEDRIYLERMNQEEADPRVRWGERPALLIIDMNYGFVTDDYPHGFAKTGMPCAAQTAKLLNKVTLFDLHMKYADVVPSDRVAAYLNEG